MSSNHLLAYQPSAFVKAIDEAYIQAQQSAHMTKEEKKAAGRAACAIKPKVIKNDFKIVFEFSIAHFMPNEIHFYRHDNLLTVEAHHHKNGLSREAVYTYELPQNVINHSMTHRSSNGLLVISFTLNYHVPSHRRYSTSN